MTKKIFGMVKIGSLQLFFLLLNSMIGGGLFINLSIFGNTLGQYSYLPYIFGYLIFFPIVYCVGKLAEQESLAGGMLYSISKSLGDNAGHFAAWVYFLGRVVSIGVLVQTLVTCLVQTVPALQSIPTPLLSFLVILQIVIYNIAGISNTGKVQHIFTALKLLPIFFLIITGAFCLKSGCACPNIFTTQSSCSNLAWPTFLNLPSAIYALQGFTVVLHLRDKIRSGKQLLITLLLAAFGAAAISILFQFILTGSCLTEGSNISSQGIILNLISRLQISYPAINFLAANLVSIAVGSCAFMILTSNAWNLFAIAQNNLLPGSGYIATIYNGVPVVCLAIHGLLSFLLIQISNDIVSLQAASVFATIFAYMLCSTAATKLFWQRNELLNLLLGCSAILSALVIILISLYKFSSAKMSHEFLLLLIGGIIIMQIYKAKEKSN